jgi:hypothetical protein
VRGGHVGHHHVRRALVPQLDGLALRHDATEDEQRAVRLRHEQIKGTSERLFQKESVEVQ